MTTIEEPRSSPAAQPLDEPAIALATAGRRVPITCLILTYNEESRIHIALTHALAWADEVIVLDKHSTDSTREIALRMGARVHLIPFSRQGHERYEDMIAPATHDWVWHFTPGEVPTRRVIEEARRLLSSPFAAVSPTPASAGGHERGENSGQTPGG